MSVLHTLDHQYQPDAKPGDVVSTVRNGTKWTKARPGHELNLRAGPNAADQVVFGRGTVVENEAMKFADIPAKLIETNGDPHARTYSGLLADMKKCYGEAFSENDFVTVVTYRRDS